MERISKKFQKFYGWKLEDKETRISRQDFMHENSVSIMQMTAYEEAYQKPPEVDLPEQIRVQDKSLYDASLKENATYGMKTLWYTRHQLLIHKTEQKVIFELSADEHRRIRAEGQQRLQDEVGGRTGGNGGVFSGVQGMHLLPKEVCVDNQQEHSEEG